MTAPPTPINEPSPPRRVPVAAGPGPTSSGLLPFDLQRRFGNRGVTQVLRQLFEPDPAIEAVRSRLRDGDEEGALAAIRALNDVQGRRALADANLRDEAVSTFDDEEMAEAVRTLTGDLLSKLRWLMAEDTSIREVMPIVRSAPQAERVAVYADQDLRDWFVDICGDVEMLQLVLALGGRLIQQLRWMAAEDSDWFPVYVLLDAGSEPDERREVLESAEMRRFFQESYGDNQVATAVTLLGGPDDLSLQMEWLQAEGADATPANAQKRPEIAPRDEALLSTLDRTTPLFRLFEAAENAREELRSHLLAQSMAAGDMVVMVADPMADQLMEKQKAAETALDVELKKMGYADLAAFKDEFRRFEAFFHGFALQTAFLMLQENRDLAVKEAERMRGDALGELYDELGPARELLTARLDAQEAYKDIPAAGVTPEGERAGVLIQRERDLEAQVADLMPKLAVRFPIIARQGERDWVVEHAYDREGMAKHFQEFATSTVEDIDEVREKLSADSSKIWKMAPVLDRAKAALGVADGSAMDGIIRRKIAQVERDETFAKLVVGALAIGLGLLSMGTGAVAVIAAAGALTVSLYQVGESWEEYSYKSAAYGSALDLADALGTEDPSVVWLLVDIAGALLDLKGVVSAGQAAAKAATKAVITEAAGTFGETAAKLRFAADAKTAAEAARELEVLAARYGPEVQALVREAAQRELAKITVLAESPDLVRQLKEIATDIAADDETLAGLVHMGQTAAVATTKALVGEPALLQRLGRLCAQDPAVALGAARLHSVVGEEAALGLLRDALLRRDASFARRFLGAAGDGHLGDDALRAAVREGPAAAERELAAATGIPAPGTPEARAALESTAKVDGKPGDILDLKNEWETVQSSHGLSIQEGDYVVEVTLPNGHKWKRHKGGGWCRYSTGFCLTAAEMKALDTAPVDPLTRSLRTAEQETAAAEAIVADPDALVARFRRFTKEGLDPYDELTQAELDALERMIHQRNSPALGLGPPVPEDLTELTPADVRSLFDKPKLKIDPRTGKPTKSAADYALQDTVEAELKALAELGASNRPLLDKLHDALRQTTKDRILKRATKNGVAFDEFLQARPPSGALDIDHVIPLETIVNMPGFKGLPWTDQVVISNAVGNLKAVDMVVNRSRQAASYASQFAGRSLYTAEALKAAQDFEPEALKVITNLLDRARKAPGSLTMADIL